MVTYLITPYGNAFELDRPQFTCDPVRDIETNSTVIGYAIYVSGRFLDTTYQVSPTFTVLTHDLNLCYIECENIDDCKFESISWLEDLLKCITKCPSVIHCVSDGEQFIS